MRDETGWWARVCAVAGAALWAGIAVLTRLEVVPIGEIELLFLFAPLVMVPLGMELGRAISGSNGFGEVARRMQPFAAAATAAAMAMPPGRTAGIAAAGWMLVCTLAAVDGLVQLVSAARADAGKSARGPRSFRPTAGSKTAEIAIAVARVDLAVGGAWLVASRLGLRPMGIQEPIGLLTAVHFHYAGFATATIAAATLRFVERGGLILPHENRPWTALRAGSGWARGTRGAWLQAIVMTVIAMPFVVAAGFVISPALKMGAALVFSASVAALAVFLRACGRRAHDSTARPLLQAASVAVFAGMLLAGAYAVADAMGSDRLTIPQMARTHGLLNAFGFCLIGLLGWLVETSGPGSGDRDRP